MSFNFTGASIYFISVIKKTYLSPQHRAIKHQNLKYLDKPLSDTQTYTLMQNNNAFPRNSTPDTNSKSKPKAVSKEYRLLRLRQHLLPCHNRFTSSILEKEAYVVCSICEDRYMLPRLCPYSNNLQKSRKEQLTNSQ